MATTTGKQQQRTKSTNGLRRMTTDEFLAWLPENDRIRYELDE